MRCARLVFASALVVAASLASVQAGSPPVPDTMDRVTSPSGKIIATLAWSGDDKPRKIWLTPAGTPGPRVELCEFERSADVLFSIDDEWIAVNDWMGSNEADVRFFRRDGGLRYIERKVDVAAGAWAFLERNTGLSTSPHVLGHRYAVVVAWLPQRPSVLLRLSGHGEAGLVDGWFCIYDLDRGRFTLDLSDVNRGAVTIDPVRR